MSNSNSNKHRRQIRKLVHLLITRHDISSICANDIADCLECPQDVAEEELDILHKDGVLKPVLELHCAACGNILAFYETPHLLARHLVECPVCWAQSSVVSINDLVSAYEVCKED